MASITVKKIPEKLYSALKRQAGFNHRSINGEILNILERNLIPTTVDIDSVLDRARTLRQFTASNPISADDIGRWKEEGRL